jgi:hypothetical protein
VIEPAEFRRVSFEEIECPACGSRFRGGGEGVIKCNGYATTTLRFRNRTLMEDRNRDVYNVEFLEAAVSPTEDVVPGADSTDQRDTKVEV